MRQNRTKNTPRTIQKKRLVLLATFYSKVKNCNRRPKSASPSRTNFSSKRQWRLSSKIKQTKRCSSQSKSKGAARTRSCKKVYAKDRIIRPGKIGLCRPRKADKRNPRERFPISCRGRFRPRDSPFLRRIPNRKHRTRTSYFHSPFNIITFKSRAVTPVEFKFLRRTHTAARPLRILLYTRQATSAVLYPLCRNLSLS